LLDGASLPESTSERIAENFSFFQNLIAEADLPTAFAGIKKLVAVQVVLLCGQDDPQLIFESLNSTGLELAQADLIRNFVLMRQEEQIQTSLYDGFWRPMEVEFDSRYRAGFDRFVRDFLTLELHPSKQFKASEIYQEFRNYFYTRDGEPEAASILANLKRYATYYVSLSTVLIPPGEAKAEACEAVRWVVPDATGRADVFRFNEPGPTATRAQLASACRPSRPVSRRPVVVFVITIFCPLPDIAQHVIEAQGVRFETTHRRGVSVAVGAVVDTPCFGVGDLIPCRLVCDIRIRARLIRIFTPEPG
jgi:hypothetical protein